MVDLHCHILPGIDDGSENIEESLQMCRLAFSDGIRTIVATPHVGKYPNTKEIILEKTEVLKQKISSLLPGLSLFCGADIEFSADIFALIAYKSLLTINNSRYILLDTPYFLMPPDIEKQIQRLIEEGVAPIITHPERCLQIQEDIDLVRKIVEAGAVVQITASSITGKMGAKAQSVSKAILKAGLAHVIATDAHGASKRPPMLSEAATVAATIIGKDMAQAMVSTIPQSIIEDKLLDLPRPRK